jgi:hypothetical protein
LGPTHANTLNSINNLAFLYDNKGELDKTEAMRRRCVEGYEETLGLGDRLTVYHRGLLGAVLAKQTNGSERKQGQTMVETSIHLLKEEHQLPPSHRWLEKLETALLLSP